MKNIYRVVAVILALLIVVPAQAALVDRGGGLIYDTDFNITWLADANYSKTSGYDADGFMNWYQATTWANQLVYGGFDDWRLPATLWPDATCVNVYMFASGPYKNCRGSEMGHLFYDELGGVYGSSIVAVHNSSYSLFNNLYLDNSGSPKGMYWSGTERYIGGFAWIFTSQGQEVGNLFKTHSFYAMAVRDGDVVSAAPIPTSIWLFGTGLIGMFGFVRRQV